MSLIGSQENGFALRLSSLLMGPILRALELNDMMPLQAESWQSNQDNFIVMNSGWGGISAGTLISCSKKSFIGFGATLIFYIWVTEKQLPWKMGMTLDKQEMRLLFLF